MLNGSYRFIFRGIRFFVGAAQVLDVCLAKKEYHPPLPSIPHQWTRREANTCLQAGYGRRCLECVPAQHAKRSPQEVAFALCIEGGCGRTSFCCRGGRAAAPLVEDLQYWARHAPAGGSCAAAGPLVGGGVEATCPQATEFDQGTCSLLLVSILLLAFTSKSF